MSDQATVPHAERSQALSRLLSGAWITRVEFARTGWELEFGLPEYEFANSSKALAPSEDIVLAAEADPNSDVEADAETARILVLATAQTIESVAVDANANLSLLFTQGLEVRFPGSAGPVDEVWYFYVSSGLRRRAGEPSLAMSYFGEVSFDPRLLTHGEAT